MKSILAVFTLMSFFSCVQAKKQSENDNNTIELYNSFDKKSHLQPVFDKIRFDTLHNWDVGWALLEPINIAKDDEDEKLLAKKLSPGQKALYFFWYLDAEVTNGGFIQFYWNDYGKYIPPILEGLRLIGDPTMTDLVNDADKEYLANKDKFNLQKQKGDWEPLYNNLKKFETYDSIYYKIHDKTMELIEKYVRQNPDDFVKFQ